MSDDNQSKFNTAMLQSVERMRNEALNLVAQKEAENAVLKEMVQTAAKTIGERDKTIIERDAEIAALKGAPPKSKANGKGARAHA